MNLSRLNTRQREAVLHGEGPLLILAGAGSGKTSTMAYRIAHLISVRKFPARAILGLSFTNKAAAELKERVTGLVTQTCGQDALKELTVSTFHSLCVKILRAYGHKLGFQNNFTIMDASDQRDVLKQVFKNVRIDDRKFDLDRILFQIGQAKGRFLGPAHAQDYFLGSGSQLPGDYGIAAATSYEHYQGQLKAQNAMDFDDLLFNAVTLLETFKDVREHYNQRFKYVLVDEYQDTNPAQFKLLRLLTEQQQNLCVVGDDDQSIYAWRGADPTHILEFAHQFKDARTITLDQNYRSTTTILDAANSVISNNKHRHPKKLWSERGEGEPIQEMVLADDREEARYVAEEIFRLAKEQKRRWSDFAVLYRSNTQSRVFEESLRLLRVPYKIVGGYSFLERKEVKNTLAYWRLASNPDDDASLRRVLNWPARGFGKTTLEALGNEAFSSGKSLYETLKRAG
ncbi:MAG TPA: ATP-dependent DNA helicase PcrA, partial [Bdellovibrionales bacterium]|nr:ATP-dependent DNA helicase PcrA [Bdellovibrionales bacterium]